MKMLQQNTGRECWPISTIGAAMRDRSQAASAGTSRTAPHSSAAIEATRSGSSVVLSIHSSA